MDYFVWYVVIFIFILLFSYRAEKTEVLSDDLLQVTISLYTLTLYAVNVIFRLWKIHIGA